MLGAERRILKFYLICIGVENALMFHAAEVIRLAVAIGAAALLLVHNHPNGDPTPCPSDPKAAAVLARGRHILRSPPATGPLGYPCANSVTFLNSMIHYSMKQSNPPPKQRFNPLAAVRPTASPRSISPLTADSIPVPVAPTPGPPSVARDPRAQEGRAASLAPAGIPPRPSEAPPNEPRQPALRSSNSEGGTRTKAGRRAANRGDRPSRSVIAHEALGRALNNTSLANYPAIIEGFAKMGIPESEIRPRENVFTFHAWLAQGRSVRKGQHGVKVCSRIPCQPGADAAAADQAEAERAEYAGEPPATRTGAGRSRPVFTTVFHVSQTDAVAARGTVATAPELGAAKRVAPKSDEGGPATFKKEVAPGTIVLPYLPAEGEVVRLLTQPSGPHRVEIRPSASEYRRGVLIPRSMAPPVPPVDEAEEAAEAEAVALEAEAAASQKTAIAALMSGRDAKLPSAKPATPVLTREAAVAAWEQEAAAQAQADGVTVTWKKAEIVPIRTAAGGVAYVAIPIPEPPIPVPVVASAPAPTNIIPFAPFEKAVLACAADPSSVALAKEEAVETDEPIDFFGWLK